MSNFKEFIYNAIGKLYIPPELTDYTEKRLLHISDTPIGFFSDLRKLIKVLKPDYIVHTGDLTDNIKLQIYPTSIADHRKWIKCLAELLEDSEAEVILALGNHDSYEVVSEYFKRSHIIKEAETIVIEGMNFRISHFPGNVLQEPAEYNLFGHDLTLRSGYFDNRQYFNGISFINIIGLESGEHSALRYPAGTDDARLGRRKIGL